MTEAICHFNLIHNIKLKTMIYMIGWYADCGSSTVTGDWFCDTMISRLEIKMEVEKLLEQDKLKVTAVTILSICKITKDEYKTFTGKDYDAHPTKTEAQKEKDRELLMEYYKYACKHELSGNPATMVDNFLNEKYK